ncbi:hypothetical protein [Halococcus saccharolyticus]|uniref:DUF8112 domain-containing protein n=1 Tax=Halococcus saccharolyticus DSM 5350 TaxID=1227455 RepID=M0MQP9_9EURY|nr:hypothetical protein [Halococcus saccharolyticus]EMA47956.1 hypothetical protein C449_00750 [Halococcus saccharolyticus DSM 5350]
MTDPLNARQALEGIELPQPTRCRDCHVKQYETTPISVVAERPHDAAEWHVVCAMCVACAGTTVRPSPAADRILAEGEIAMTADTGAQEHWPVLIRVDVVETHELAARGVEV